jgi:hypothetical protein
MIQNKEKEKELDELLTQEEAWWQQRSRALWLQNGDRNTKFFHMKANQRRKRNNITRIQDNEGHTHYDPHMIEEVFVDYFKHLFASQNLVNVEAATQIVHNQLTEDMKISLNAPLTSEDILNIVHNMKSLAAPGSDGLPAKFYQQYWAIIGTDITTICLNILNNGDDQPVQPH